MSNHRGTVLSATSPPAGELQDDSSGPDVRSSPDRAIRWSLWVILVATVALIGFVIYATVHLRGPTCWRTSVSVCRS